MSADSDLHLLVHTARMQLLLAEQPKHPRAKEYRNQTLAYAARWAQLSPLERKTRIAEAKGIHDMTPAIVRAAVAALEG